MSFKEQIQKENIPQHIAMVMDGNGRWAKLQGFDRLFGHNNGIGTVRQITEAAVEIGLKYLTLYTFSTENWNRPEREIAGIMKLLVENIEKETPTFIKNNVRLQVIGDIERMPKDVAEKLKNCIANTSAHTGLTLILALSYSSKWEIVKAVKNIFNDVKSGKISEEITEQTISDYLETKDFPNPDMLIRTGGEVRISNFLLWQAAYSELFFTDIYWPDFTKENFYEMIVEYQKRERRFGKTSEQLK
ncbi:MAG: isoprenyl transferase [Prevotellaceae bacterium]|jgi:undecaprenyl diphosphate synthase|nr:isoprenyl transferase [Prevotellaceae bacterium]